MANKGLKGPKLERYRGDTKAHVFTVVDGDGVVVDITSWTFLFTVDSSLNPANADTQLFQVTGSITDAAAGKVEFVPSAVQADQDPGSYYYDVEATDAASRLDTLAKNKYTFHQDITK